MSLVKAKPISEAVDFLRLWCAAVPDAAVVLGSGVKALEDLPEAQSISYNEVFGMSPGVAGHAGSLSVGKVGNKRVCVLRGRFHLYEGHDWPEVTLIAASMAQWGVPALYLTNAAGGLNCTFKVGDLMVLTGYRDHLNTKLAETGLLPVLHKPATDCRNELVDGLLAAGEKLHKQDSSFRALQRGIYAGLHGPNYETMAEIEMLKKLKADAVGMSTVPELLTVAATKTKAAAVSVITNVWSPDQVMGGHEEVLEAAKEASQRLDKLFRAVIAG